MSELVKCVSYYNFITQPDGTASDLTEGELVFEGRTNVRSVLLMDISERGLKISVNCGINSHVEFINSLDATGDILLDVYPNITPIFWGLSNSKALFFELPGNGIMFDTGLYVNRKLVDPTSDGDTTMAVTVLYG